MMPTDIELFERIGRALTVGRDWRSALATALGIRPDSIRHMSSGRAPIRVGHLQDLLAVVVARRKELASAEQELLEFLASQSE